MNLLSRIRTLVRDREYDPENDPIVQSARTVIEDTKTEREKLRGTLEKGPTGFFLGDALIVKRREPDNDERS